MAKKGKGINTQGRQKISSKTRTNYESQSSKKTSKSPTTFWYIVLWLLVLVVSILHGSYVAQLHENDRHFSHLSTLERELTFRTEMGLYYSYFKTVAEAPTFLTGLSEIVSDNVTEYPDTINTLKRFNLYPEVFLGFWFRVYKSVSRSLNIRTKLCYTVNRGASLSSIQSCEGNGEPAYFYVNSIFTLNGIMMGVFFLYGTFLSESILGGVIVVAAFFFNHGECTRVMWTPPLRESFAYPFLVMEMLILSWMLRYKSQRNFHAVLLAINITCFMICWQFAQFALLTQTLSVFGIYMLRYIPRQTMVTYLKGLTGGYIVATVLLFLNEMLFTSFLASCLLTIWGIVALRQYLDLVKHRLLIMLMEFFLLLVGTVALKMITSRILAVTDDAHIGNILKSKFSDFRDFHTMLYICAAEFDMLPWKTFMKFVKTALVPVVVVISLIVLFEIFSTELSQFRKSKQKPTEKTIPEQAGDGPVKNTRSKKEVVTLSNGAGPLSGDPKITTDLEFNCPEMLYNLVQMVACGVMAVCIMRLKLFWTPQMCIVASLVASRKLLGFIGKTEHHRAVIVGTMAIMAVGGFFNLKHQWYILGEYSNVPEEQMLEWIMKSTPKNSSFAGPMSVMANLKLSTQRPIINHPHYEDAGLRERTKEVYSLFSRKPKQDIWDIMKRLHVDYAVLDRSWCDMARGNCSIPFLHDFDDVDNRHRPPTCPTFIQDPRPFTLVFHNTQFSILAIDGPEHSRNFDKITQL